MGFPRIYQKSKLLFFDPSFSQSLIFLEHTDSRFSTIAGGFPVFLHPNPSATSSFSLLGFPQSFSPLLQSPPDFFFSKLLPKPTPFFFPALAPVCFFSKISQVLRHLPVVDWIYFYQPVFTTHPPLRCRHLTLTPPYFFPTLFALLPPPFLTFLVTFSQLRLIRSIH